MGKRATEAIANNIADKVSIKMRWWFASIAVTYLLLSLLLNSANKHLDCTPAELDRLWVISPEAANEKYEYCVNNNYTSKTWASPEKRL